MSILQTILAILPGILICLWIFYRDRHEREPLLLLLVCFIAGVASTLPAIVMEEFWAGMGIVESENILQTFVLAFGSVALSEEWVKFVGVMICAYPWKPFNEPMDGIVYSVMVSMGFATLENVLYSNLYDLETVLLRAFTAVPAHAAFGITMGYHLGRAKFGLGNKYFQIFLALATPVILHGAYDFFLIQQNIPELSLLAMVILLICIFYTRNLINLHNENSPFKEEKISIPPPMKTPEEYNEDEFSIPKDDDYSKSWDDIIDE